MVWMVCSNLFPGIKFHLKWDHFVRVNSELVGSGTGKRHNAKIMVNACQACSSWHWFGADLVEFDQHDCCTLAETAHF